MPFTHFPGGVSSMGCPLPNSQNFPMNGQTHYWVRGVSSGAGVLGNNGNSGLTPDDPLLTMARAFALINSGDVIHFTGNIREQLSTPVGVFDVTVIGETTRPRHADAHTGNNGYSAATWKAPASPTAVTPLLVVRQQGWRFINILFTGITDAAGVQLYRDGGAGDAERDASHASFYGCRFDACKYGIEQSGGVYDIGIYGNIFRGMTDNAIKDTAGAGIGTNLLWDIADNVFQNNKGHLVVSLSGGTVRHNSFGLFDQAGGGMSVDLNNGATANVLFGNAFSGTYSITGGYRKAVAGDSWGGNYNVIAGGVTAAVPA